MSDAESFQELERQVTFYCTAVIRQFELMNYFSAVFRSDFRVEITRTSA